MDIKNIEDSNKRSLFEALGWRIAEADTRVEEPTPEELWGICPQTFSTEAFKSFIDTIELTPVSYTFEHYEYIQSILID